MIASGARELATGPAIAGPTTLVLSSGTPEMTAFRRRN